MSRLKLGDAMLDVVTKMSDGNPGAITALMEVINKHDEIDPQAIGGPSFTIMHLDDMGIYESGIYVIWSDHCKRDTRKFLMLIRSVQLGLISERVFKRMSEERLGREPVLTDGEISELDKKVCDQLEGFQKPNG